MLLSPAMPRQAGKFKPVKQIPATSQMSARFSPPALSLPMVAAATTSKGRANNNNNSNSASRTGQKGRGCRGGNRRHGQSQIPAAATTATGPRPPRKRKRHQKGTKQQQHSTQTQHQQKTQQQKKQKQQHQQQMKQNDKYYIARCDRIGGGIDRGGGGGLGDRFVQPPKNRLGLGSRFVLPRGAPFFTGDVAVVATASNNCSDHGHVPSLSSSSSSSVEEIIVSAITPGDEESEPKATTTTAITTATAGTREHLTKFELLSNPATQNNDECLPSVITTSRKESTVEAIVEKGGQHQQQHQLYFETTPAPSNDRTTMTTTRTERMGRDDYSMAIHEIIYGCQENNGDDHLNGYASQTEQGPMQEEENEAIINDISMVTLLPDDDNHSLLNNPSDNCCVKVECVNNIASINPNDPSRKEDRDDNESSDGNELEECNSVASDKSYYKDLCVRLTSALEKRKRAHRECRQEMRRIQREYSKLRRRFLDLQRSFGVDS